MSKLYLTQISQYEVKVVAPENFDGYERNKPGEDWELVQVVRSRGKNGKPIRFWTTKHSLKTPKIENLGQVDIVDNSTKRTT